MVSALGTHSLQNDVTDDTVIEHTCLHLILCDFILTNHVLSLNVNSALFCYFHIMLIHAKPGTICDLFQRDPDYANQTTISLEYRTQFLFLEVIHTMRVQSIILSLT